ncbi:sugar ABC transporter ATP-binding protein [Dactylosporangium sp. AC04546]|uniref:sugar ABC transporter ATP-binding protein n=1 Tax=Dactylosporangium sp. AC04546 TaxID=2862460 RepID=UPI001EDF067B|nr:sugar ABC transporter ATP-binding protein [Dactylosporangium sp. AC04546]WVK85239.1 sugar ABC transporter ATP-binding protein [Dactylosporangium sp. AC04546]
MTLRLRDVRKRYGGVEVLHGVSLAAAAGSVLALVGANGAGKSTLIRILSGAVRADGGEVLVDGVPADLSSPHHAHALGIRTVYQELSLVPQLSVTENLLLGRFPQRYNMIDWTAAHRRAQELLDRAGFGMIDPRELAGRLPVARQQMVEIAKALADEPRVLILDEPSAVLAGSDLDALYALVRELRQRGVLVVYVSHRLAEVLDLATDIVVLKDGQVVETTTPARTSEPELIRLMAGRRPERIYPPRRPAPGDVRLRIEDLSRPGEFTGVSFELRAGEIVGLFGLVGSGRSELAACVFGASRPSCGSGAYGSPADAIRHGVAMVTEDRAGSGLVLGLTVRDNIGLTTWHGAWIDQARQRRDVATMIERLDIRPPGCAAMPVVRLSGGNQQKAVLAKWLLVEPKVLILDEPTRGVDMATRVEIYRMVDGLAREGLAVLLISSDLTEVLGATDRVLVMNQGRITGELPSEGTTEDQVLERAIAA